MKARLKDNTVVNITGYDLSLNRFDCENGDTKSSNDFDEFIITSQEMQDIIDTMRSYIK